MTPILLIVLPLVVVLFLLIVNINQGEHYAPQAYYRRKTAGATIVFEFESLAPRPRKQAPGVTRASADDGQNKASAPSAD